MKKRRQRSLITKSGEMREPTLKEMRLFRPIHEVMSPEFIAMLPKRKVGQRGPQKQPKKILLTSRYSEDVIQYFKSTGPGWQTKMDNALREWIKKHRRAA